MYSLQSSTADANHKVRAWRLYISTYKNVFFGISVSAACLCCGQKKQNQSSKFSACMIHVDARLLELLVNEFCYLKPEPGQLSPLFFQSFLPSDARQLLARLKFKREARGWDRSSDLALNKCIFPLCWISKRRRIRGYDFGPSLAARHFVNSVCTCSACVSSVATLKY